MTHKKKLYITDILDNNTLKTANNFNAQAILCNQNKLDKNHSSNLNIIDANIYREDGSVLAYKMLKKSMTNLSKKCKKIFTIENEDYTLSFVKQLYWNVYKRGYILSAQKTLSDYNIINPIKLIGPTNYISNIIDNLRYLNKRKLPVGKPLNFNFTGDKCLLIYHTFQIFLWKNLISEFEPDSFTIILPPDTTVKPNQVKEILGKNLNIHHIESFDIATYHPEFSIKSLLNKKNSYYYNQYCKNFSYFSFYHELKKYLLSNGCKLMLVFDFENNGATHILLRPFNGLQLKLVNTNNGIKAKTGNNLDSIFSKWIIWDNEMYNLLTQDCQLPSNQFVIAGHLNEDIAHSHKYSGTLDFLLEKIKGKKIISICSNKGLRPDKVLGLNSIYEWAHNKPDVFIIYRPHHLEKITEIIKPPTKLLVNFEILSHELSVNKNCLYDQLLLTNITIVFGSTVALESKWFYKPCITFEQSKKSILYCTDEKTIYHAKNKSQLIFCIENFLKNDKKEEVNKGDNKNIALEYSKIINAELL